MEDHEKTITGLVILALFLVLRLSSCSAPRTAPYAEVRQLPTEKLQKGKELFNEYCATCHPGGMAGVGLSIVNKPLPEPLIQFQIRNGVGLMPAFSEKELSDQAVEQIAEYVVFLRRKD